MAWLFGRAVRNVHTNVESSVAFGGVFLTTVAAFVMALIGSVVSLTWYGRSVGRLMHSDEQSRDSSPFDLTPYFESRPSNLDELQLQPARIRHITLVVCAIYFVAGLIAALVTTLLVTPLALNGGLPRWRGILLFTVIYAWPVVLILTQVAHTRLKTVLMATCVQVGLFVAIATWISLTPAPDVPATPANEWQSVPAALQVLAFWLGSQFMPSVATLLVLNRYVRPIGPLMLVFSLLALNVAHGALTLTLDDSGLVSAAVLVFGAISMGEWPYPSDVALRIIGGLAIAAAVGLPLAWLANWWVSRRYTRKRESEQTIFADAVWAVFTLSAVQTLVLGGGWWGLTGVAIFAAHKAATWTGFRFARRFRPDRGPELLWLRRFKGGAQTRKLYSALQAQWRWAGPIHLLGAPDLAAQTIEPYRFLDFLTGGLKHHFIRAERDLGESLDALDLAPDRDGRFRVNEFFCGKSTWRSTAHALMQRSHLIVMDVRGFKQDSGVRDELTILTATRGLQRLVLFCAEEDLPAVKETLRELSMSAEVSQPEPFIVDPNGRERSVLRTLIERLKSLGNTAGP